MRSRRSWRRKVFRVKFDLWALILIFDLKTLKDMIFRQNLYSLSVIYLKVQCKYPFGLRDAANIRFSFIWPLTSDLWPYFYFFYILVRYLPTKFDLYWHCDLGAVTFESGFFFVHMHTNIHVTMNTHFWPFPAGVFRVTLSRAPRIKK